eukprot:SAG31_NODE_11552_length_1018_cov_1.236126_2_plen_51_part_00
MCCTFLSLQQVVDARAAAEELRRIDNEAFKTLTTTRAIFHKHREAHNETL